MKYDLISDMFPNYFKLKNTKKADDKIVLIFESTREKVSCPTCEQHTSFVTTYFNRLIQDLPIIDKALYLDIRLRKFRCSNNKCNTKVFSETIDELAGYKQRRTNRLNNLLMKVALTYSAEGGARLCKEKHIQVSGDTLLRLALKWKADVDVNEVEAIGIDDFALKKT